MKYFDAHCHIQFDGYDADRESVIQSMREADVGGLVVGVDYASSEKAVQLANGATLFAAVGLHPNDTPEEVFDIDAYRRLAADTKVIAIGECGLDYFRPEDVNVAKAKQKEVFAQHIQLAAELDKPLMIHSRPSKGTMDAYQDVIEMITEAQKEHGKKVRGDMHFFVGDIEIARQFVELGFTVSYTAVLTFTSDYDAVVQSVPLTNLISETDAPYVAPAPNRGKRNDPLAVREVVRAMARIRGEEEEVVREAVLGNARRLFKLP